MGGNQTFSFELNQDAACLLYQPLLVIDSKPDINIRLSGKTAEFDKEPSYEKSKAQRILAKKMATSTGDPHHEKDPITNTASSTTLPTVNEETVAVSQIIFFINNKIYSQSLSVI